MTKEQNKLIAEFMGATAMPDNTIKFRQSDTHFHDGTNSREVENLQYHTSWDWLMPVVEKIEKYHNGVNVNIRSEVHDRMVSPVAHNYICRIDGDKIKTQDIFSYGQSYTSKLEAVYQAVIQFIEWYNQQNKTL